MNIAICDDEVEIRRSIKKLIADMYPESIITEFDCGGDLCACVKKFDIIYLDIKMNNTNGIETARTLRAEGCKSILIFITAFEEYVYQAFDVNAFHYLLKPFEAVKFYEVLKRASEQAGEIRCGSIREKEDSVIVKNGKNHIRVYFSDIIYAEVFNRRVIIHTADDEIEYYGKISALEKQAGRDFFRPHRSYLINLRYVLKYNSEEIFLDKGHALIAKQKYREFVKKYLEYIKTEDGK